MKNVFRLSPQAIQDLLSIEDFIYDDNPQASVEITQKILVSIENKLVKFKEIGRPGRIIGTRELIVTNTPYIAVYRMKNGYIEIIRILHSSGKWPDSVEELEKSDSLLIE